MTVLVNFDMTCTDQPRTSAQVWTYKRPSLLSTSCRSHTRCTRSLQTQSTSRQDTKYNRLLLACIPVPANCNTPHIHNNSYTLPLKDNIEGIADFDQTKYKTFVRANIGFYMLSIARPHRSSAPRRAK